MSSNENLWSQFAGQVSAKMGGGNDNVNIQVLPNAQILAGNTVTELSTAIDNFGAIIPQWSSFYASTENRIIQAYQAILSQIQETATVGKSIQKKYVNESNTLHQMMGKASDYKVGKIGAWQKQVQVYVKAGLTPPTFAHWFANNGLQYYKGLLDNQQTQQKVVAKLLSAEGIASPLVTALANLNTEISKINSASSPELTLVPTVDMIANWSKQPTNPGGFSITESTDTYDYSKSIWKSQSGTDLLGFLSINSKSGGVDKINLLSASKTYELDFNFQAQTAITLSQGNWFDSSQLVDYKKGPWLKGSQLGDKKAVAYGRDGIFPLAITRVYVVFNPSVSITLDEKEMESLNTKIRSNESSGIHLGPFAFGGKDKSHATSMCKTNSLNKKQTLTIRDTSNHPQIIAVVCEQMP